MSEPGVQEGDDPNKKGCGPAGIGEPAERRGRRAGPDPGPGLAPGVRGQVRLDPDEAGRMAQRRHHRARFW
jgi:hypothetical protein